MIRPPVDTNIIENVPTLVNRSPLMLDFKLIKMIQFQNLNSTDKVRMLQKNQIFGLSPLFICIKGITLRTFSHPQHLEGSANEDY